MKKGFTLIEMLAVIVILGITITIVAIKVDSNIKNSNKFENERMSQTLEEAAILFVENYRSELTSISSKGVDTISISQLINKGLISRSDVKDSVSNIIVVADIDGIIKAKYTKTSQNVIFLNGGSQISIYRGSSYIELGAYVAIPGSGLVELTSSNISSNVNINTAGDYEVTYTYAGTTTVKRIVNVI